MNIQGQWTGIITYGKSYGKYENEKLYFEMEIIQNKNKIFGTSIDISGFGMDPDKAKINGTFVNNKINFIKQYSCYHYFKKGKRIFIRSKPGYEIHYSGNYDVHKNIFMGNWIIDERIKVYGFIPLRVINTGEWTMKRK